MNVEVKPPEKKKEKDSSPSPTPPSFSLLPDEMTVNCLARIPRSYYPKLSVVSKTFKSILSSKEIYSIRSHLGSTEQCLYVCLWDPSRQFPEWFSLWINPNRTKKRIQQLLVPIPSSNFPSTAKSLVVGSEIYVIGGPVEEEGELDCHNWRDAPNMNVVRKVGLMGVYNGKPSSTVRVLDCRSHTWRDGPRMNVARRNAFTCFYNGKIYVIGGVKDHDLSFAEVFDIETQTWECLPDPGTEVRECCIAKIAEMDGKINFGGQTKMYAYDTKQGKWESCVNISATGARSGCVIENESYYFGYNFSDMHSFGLGFEWININGGHYKELKGLGSLVDMYVRKSHSGNIETVSCGGKLYVMWEGYMRRNCDHLEIWCAEISVEKRDGGEIWGNVEWVDVVHKVPRSCCLWRFLAASV